ncbi:MAG TPA: family 16 glycoside hydrolase [Verrucomicrobiae bacterium]|nr:family 16 glycoside hydrolase [Verrucomicrobiae bacterium]
MKVPLMNRHAWVGACLFALALSGQAGVQVNTAFRDDAGGALPFTFTNVPAPAKGDAATAGRVRILAGVVDPNSGGIATLRDGLSPAQADEPEANFFFDAGTEGGRLLFDLERIVEVKQVNTYSRHPDARGPQVYKLFASDGTAAGFVERPQKDTDLVASGWKPIATVDTRPKSGAGGGQHGVSISDSDGILGKYRYLLFDISRTEARDVFGNTFYSEIDVIEHGATNVAAAEVAAAPYVFKSSDGYCEFSIDTARAPELKEWAADQLAPVLADWFPKIAAMLPSEGFAPPKQITILIRPGDGVAAAGGSRITANSTWLKRELKGEAVGALVHEVVHVVQQYGGRRRDPDAKRPPGWLVEGIPDYIRFFKYEPQNHGADLIWLMARRNQTLNYDGMYRISANFLNYVVEQYGKTNELIAKVNAACRQGKYTDELWRELTGKALSELNDEWKQSVKQQIDARLASGLNVVTDEERAAGWRLLFNGEDFAGWHNFKRDGVRPGWQVKDGMLVCADPQNAGDLVTTAKFRAFELELEYNISEGGNSGIIFHVTDEGGAVWATGPEFQLEDNAKAKDPQRCGWLYALYKPADDPKTGKPLDATKPAGEWNKVRLVISPDKCEHWINGVKYFDYVIGSDDFKARVAASKFSRMPLFAKSGEGYIALQGDHGQISFRNIKVRSLPVRTANR